MVRCELCVTLRCESYYRRGYGPVLLAREKVSLSMTDTFCIPLFADLKFGSLPSEDVSPASLLAQWGFI
jgi:hypothetical protein